MFLGVSCIICFMTGNDWKRVGDAVVRRRSELGMTTREALAHATKLSTRMLSDLEKARRTNFDPGALARIEIALRWKAGSIKDVLKGREPTPIDQAAPTSSAPPRTWAIISDLTERMAISLRAQADLFEWTHQNIDDEHHEEHERLAMLAAEPLMAAPHAEPMRSEFQRLNAQKKGDDHGVEAAPEPDASTEGDEGQEALVARDDPQPRRRLPRSRAARNDARVGDDEHGDVGDQFGGG